MIIKLLQEPGESGPRYCDYRTSLNQTSIARHNSMQQDKNDAASADHKVKSEHSQVVHVCHGVECSAGSLGKQIEGQQEESQCCHIHVVTLRDPAARRSR